MERRITAIKLIQRIKQHEIDGFAATLASIRARQSAIHDEFEDLKKLHDREGRVSIPEAAPFLAGFLRAINARRKFLAEQSAELDSEAAVTELQIQTVFAEMKANDSALSKAEEEVKLEHERAETATAEEVARNLFLRRHRKSRIVP